MIRVALAQINTTVGDLEGNFEKILQNIRRARQIKADLVIFPELSVTGYPPEDLLFKKSFIKDNLAFLKEITTNTKGLTALVGFVDASTSLSKGSIYNACAVLHDGKFEEVYHKICLPNYGVFDERRYFTHGKGVMSFELKGALFGLTICEDLWVDNGPIERLVREYAPSAIINISASPYHMGKHLERQRLIEKRAKEAKAFIFYNNLVGGQDELVFDGASMICDEKGKLIASGKQFEEDFIVYDYKP